MSRQHQLYPYVDDTRHIRQHVAGYGQAEGARRTLRLRLEAPFTTDRKFESSQREFESPHVQASAFAGLPLVGLYGHLLSSFMQAHDDLRSPYHRHRHFLLTVGLFRHWQCRLRLNGGGVYRHRLY